MRAGDLTAVTKSAVVASASSLSRHNVAIANAPPIGCLVGKISPQGNIHPFSWVNWLLYNFRCFREGIYIFPKLDKADCCLLNHPSNCYEKKPMPNPWHGPHPGHPPRTSVSVKKPFNKVISSAWPSSLWNMLLIFVGFWFTVLTFPFQQKNLPITGWWFQPIWKILVKLDRLPRYWWMVYLPTFYRHGFYGLARGSTWQPVAFFCHPVENDAQIGSSFQGSGWTYKINNT